MKEKESLVKIKSSTIRILIGSLHVSLFHINFAHSFCHGYTHQKTSKFL